MNRLTIITLAVLLLAPLAALRTGPTLPDAPSFEEVRVGFPNHWKPRNTMTFDDWN